MARRGENIYKRKDGRYEGRYIKGRKLSGAPLFGYVYGYSYAEVKTRLSFCKAMTADTAALCVVGQGTLSEYLHHWLEHYTRPRVKPATYAQYHERVRLHILPVLGGVLVSRLSAQQAQRFVDALVQKGLSASTVRNIALLLCAAMKKAAELRLTRSNPCANLTLPPPERAESHALNRAEQLRLERCLAPCDTTSLGVLLALYTGLRIGELCALRWRDIDLTAHTLTVRATLQRVKNFGDGGPKTILTEGPPKSCHSQRSIPLPDDVADKLALYGQNVSGDCYLLSGSTTPTDPHTFRERFKKIARQAGLDISFHTLRHTFATRCLEHNFDVQTVSELLGHATASVTLKVYAHSVWEHKRMLAGRLRLLSEMNKPSNEPSGGPPHHRKTVAKQRVSVPAVTN